MKWLQGIAAFLALCAVGLIAAFFFFAGMEGLAKEPVYSSYRRPSLLGRRSLAPSGMFMSGVIFLTLVGTVVGALLASVAPRRSPPPPAGMGGLKEVDIALSPRDSTLLAAAASITLLLLLLWSAWRLVFAPGATGKPYAWVCLGLMLLGLCVLVGILIHCAKHANQVTPVRLFLESPAKIGQECSVLLYCAPRSGTRYMPRHYLKLMQCTYEVELPSTRDGAKEQAIPMQERDPLDATTARFAVVVPADGKPTASSLLEGASWHFEITQILPDGSRAAKTSDDINVTK